MADRNPLEIARQWHAGETGCGVLIMQLKREISKISAGQLLRVTALDDGAPEDLPAWCRLTGHAVVTADHPTYVLKKNGG